MAQPQRHRLLQGYPMLPLMRRHQGARPVLDSARPLIVGVLPHPFCNPKRRGCGFCTFPHEPFRRANADKVVDAVIAETQSLLDSHAHLAERTVHGLYFGGGTANLTPPAAFSRLLATLSKGFDLRQAEVTLEGVPIYFIARRFALLEQLMSVPARHRRISMGIQTFDTRLLEQMGRSAFGGIDEVRNTVRWCQARGMTVSGDLLFNLPGQSLAEMVSDVLAAVDVGLDQICLYNLVLYEGLGTPWSHDPEMLAACPDNLRACQHWLRLRELLLEQGYVQTTLTNFERASLPEQRRFHYEHQSFSIERYDGLGLGPGAISCFSSDELQSSFKAVNTAGSRQYVDAIRDAGHATALGFDYDPLDRKLLLLTRGLPLLSLDRRRYTRLFGSDVADDFAPVLDAARRADLLTFSERAIELTPKGMFFADAIAGLLAEDRVAEVRAAAAGHRSVTQLAVMNDSMGSHMG